MKIDIFTHVNPRKYHEVLSKACPNLNLPSQPAQTPLSDPDLRYESMADLEDVVQILTLGQPPIERVAAPKTAADLARIANNEMAEFVSRYPDRFIAAVAALPMNNMDAVLKEVDRAINELNFKGVQIYTSIIEKPLDSPEFLPLYEKMSHYDLPIWIHPTKDLSESDYPGEEGSLYSLAAIIGWPNATSMAMTRLAGSGILEKYPNLKFITHHAGGTVPYLYKRIECSPFPYGDLSRPITDSLRLFYNDTAVQGNIPNLMCAYAFCGANHLLFGTDYMGDSNMAKETIRAIEEMIIPEADKEKIFTENAKRLLYLSV